MGIYNSGALTTGSTSNSDVGVFLKNAISYSNTVGPVGLAAGYSVSETQGAVYSLGATYTGPVSLSAAYQSTNKPNTTDRISTLYSIGAGYTMGAFTSKLNFLRGENKNLSLADTSKVDTVGLGLDWKTAANNTASAVVYSGKNKLVDQDKTMTFILSDEYSLSKRTTLYGTLVFADAKANASALTSVALTPVAKDKNTTLLNIGVKHSF